MHTRNEATIRADPKVAYRLAAFVERWPSLLPHYRSVRILEESGQRRLVEMAAHRNGIPVRWWAEQVCYPDVPRITYRHVRGITAGMDVVWSFTPKGDGLEVAIEHDLELRWPLLGRPVADRIIGPFFVANIASKTLSRIKLLAESVHGEAADGEEPG